MRRRQVVSLLGGAALAPLTALPVYADPPDGCGVPVARDDGWPVASVNEDKLIDRGALCRMADRLAASSTGNVHAVLVARGGKLGVRAVLQGFRRRWDDSQIVSKAWIDASITPQMDATGLFFDGYLWWLGRSLLNGREVHWAGALGRGGQSIRIVPELNLVAVVTAGYYQDYSPRAFEVQSGRLAGDFASGLDWKRRRAAPLVCLWHWSDTGAQRADRRRDTGDHSVHNTGK